MHTATTAGNTRSSSLSRRTAVLLSCSALVALAPAIAQAQERAGTGDSTVLETITVEGAAGDDDSKSIVATRTTSGGKIATDILDTPASVSVITAKEIQQRGARSVEEVLDYTAGVNTDFYGSDDRFDYFKIRGFDAYTYRDGLTLGNPFGAIREEPYAFERVEVLKGANSTAFGVSNPGGSVNYVTKRPKSERFGEVYATGGSYGHAETGFDFGDNVTQDNTLSYRLTGKLQKAEKEYDYSQDDEKFVMGGLTWRPAAGTSLTLVYDYLDKDGVPGGGGHPVGSNFDRSLFLGEPDYNYDTTERNTVSLMFDHAFGSGLTFNSNARYSKSDTGFGYAYVYEPVDNGDTIANRYFFGNDSSRQDFVIDAHLQYDRDFGVVGSQTLVGLEYGDHRSDSDLYWAAAPGIDWTNPVYTGGPSYAGPYSSKKTTQSTKAVYAQQNLTFYDKLTVNLGLRNDWLDLKEDDRLASSTKNGDFSESTARVGLTYKLTEELAAFANYAQSVAPPALGVEPERGEQYELGLKYRPEAFPALFTASVYDLTKSNIVRTNPATNLPDTLGKVRVRGVDFEAKAELTDSLSLTAAYSYMMSDIVENGGTPGNPKNEGNEMSFVPNNVASLWLNYELEGEGLRGDMTFGLGARYQSRYYFDNANTQSTGGNIVFDAAFSYALRENTTLQVNVSNLFDEKHIAYGGFGADWYNPGRTIFATLRQTW